MRIVLSALLVAALPLTVAAQNPRVLNLAPALGPARAAPAGESAADTTITRLVSTGHPDSLARARRLMAQRIIPQARDTAVTNRITRLYASAHSDSIRKARELALDLQCASGLKLKSVTSWLAVRPDVASCVWGPQGIEGLDLTSVFAGSQSAAAYSDLVAVYFGPLRGTVATMVAAAAEDSDDDTNQKPADARAALQRLVSGGGNLLATVQLPLIRLQSPALNNFKLAVIASGRFATDVSALGAGNTNLNENLAGAVNAHANIYSNDRQVVISGYWRSEGVRGSGDLLRVIQEETTTPAAADTVTIAGKNFGYSRVSVGALLWRTVQITWTRPYFCSACETLGIGSQASISFQKQGP